MTGNIIRFDRLRLDLLVAERALKSLDDQMARLKFDPGDPESVKEAIQQMEAAIDIHAVLSYLHTDLVSQVTQGLKDKYREKILERVNAAKK